MRYVTSLVLLITIITPTSNAQTPYWQRSRGPWGGAIERIAEAPNGTLFTAAGQWLFGSTNDGARWDSVGSDNREQMTIIAATPRGTLIARSTPSRLFRSTDNGASWNQIDFDGNDFIGVPIVDANGVIYMGFFGIWFSIDDGLTWQHREALFGSSIIAFASVAPDSLVIATYDGLYLSRDSCRSAQQTFFPQAGLVMGVTRTASGELFMIMNGAIGPSRVERSSDNGATWNRADAGLEDSLVTVIGPNGGSTVYAGTDSGGIARWNAAERRWMTGAEIGQFGFPATSFNITKNGTVFATTNIGIFKSNDDGRSWSQSSAGIAAKEAVVRYDGHGDMLAMDYWAVYRSRDVGASWQTLGSFFIPLDAITTSRGTLIVASQRGISRSTNDGISWTHDTLGVRQVRASVTHIIEAPDATLYAAMRNGGLKRSTDDGVTWTTMTESLAFTALLMSTDDQLMIGIRDENARVSSDRGETWSQHPLVMPPSVGAVRRYRGDTLVYATQGGELGYYDPVTQTNHVVPVTVAGERLVGIRDVAVGKDALLYICSGVVWRGTLTVPGWEDFSSGLVEQDITNLAVHPSGYIFAGTSYNSIVQTSAALTSVRDESLGASLSIEASSGSLTICMTLDKAADGSIFVSNIVGENVARFERGFDAGENRETIDLDGIPIGSYLVRVEAGAQSASQLVSITR